MVKIILNKINAVIAEARKELIEAKIKKNAKAVRKLNGKNRKLQEKYDTLSKRG